MRPLRPLLPLFARKTLSGNETLFPCPADNNRVADFKTKTLNFILIVKRGAADGYAAYLHRPQNRHRSKNARAAYLRNNIFNYGFPFFRSELISDSAAGSFADNAQAPNVLLGVDHNNNTVNFKRQFFAMPSPVFMEFKHSLKIAKPLIVGINPKTQRM